MGSILLASAIVFCGLIIYAWFNPKQYLEKKKAFSAKWNTNIDSIFFDLEKDGPYIRKGNKLSLLICAISALLIALDGIFAADYGLPDVTAEIFLATAVLIFPIRYLYISRIRR